MGYSPWDHKELHTTEVTEHSTQKRGPSTVLVGMKIGVVMKTGKQYGGFTKKLRIELPYDPTVPLPGKYLRKEKKQTQKDTCTSRLIAALFMIVKTWKRSACPLTDGWINKI